MKGVAGTESLLDYPTSAYGQREDGWREREKYLEILTCTWAPASSSLLRFLLLAGDIVVWEMEGMLSPPIPLPHTLAVFHAPVTSPALACGYLEADSQFSKAWSVSACIWSRSRSRSQSLVAVVADPASSLAIWLLPLQFALGVRRNKSEMNNPYKYPGPQDRGAGNL